MWKFCLIQVGTCGFDMSFAKDPHLMLLLHVTIRRTRPLGAYKYKPSQSWKLSDPVPVFRPLPGRAQEEAGVWLQGAGYPGLAPPPPQVRDPGRE